MSDSITKIADEIMRLVQHGATVDWRPNMAEIATRLRALSPAGGDWVMVPREELLSFKTWFNTDSALGRYFRAKVDSLVAASPQQEPGAVGGEDGEGVPDFRKAYARAADLMETSATQPAKAEERATGNREHCSKCDFFYPKGGFCMCYVKLPSKSSQSAAANAHDPSGQTLAGAGGDGECPLCSAPVKIWRDHRDGRGNEYEYVAPRSTQAMAAGAPTAQKPLDESANNAGDTQRVDVARLSELLAKATPGPWRWNENGNIMAPGSRDVDEICAVYTDDEESGAPNAPLIVEAINALPALLQQLADYQMAASAEAQLADERGDTIIQLHAKLAERDAEIALLNRDVAEAREVFRQEYARAEAAERAKEESDDLLRDAWGFTTCDEGLYHRIAALLAANGSDQEKKP